jgi:hypothetical protein
MNEQPMHPFTESQVIQALEQLHATLTTWRELHQSGSDDGSTLLECGWQLIEDVGDAVVAFRDTRKRRQKELAAEYRLLAKPAIRRE